MMTIDQFIEQPLERQTVEQFRLVDEAELKMFSSMAMHAATHNDESLKHIVYAVVMAKRKGNFNNVKFGCDAYKEPTY